MLGLFVSIRASSILIDKFMVLPLSATRILFLISTKYTKRQDVSLRRPSYIIETQKNGKAARNT